MVEQQSNAVKQQQWRPCQSELASMSLVTENNHVAMSFTILHGSDDHIQLILILLSPQKE